MNAYKSYNMNQCGKDSDDSATPCPKAPSEFFGFATSRRIWALRTCSSYGIKKTAKMRHRTDTSALPPGHHGQFGWVLTCFEIINMVNNGL